MMENRFDPSAVESRMARAWEEAKAFVANRPERVGAQTFSIVIPPPNVTGSLHMGHALNNTLQDILCRYWRMRGKNVLWQPGTDHAGIATQMVVERQLAERGEPSRRDMGREKFLEKVWAWKKESGDTIIGQLKRLGASCDWSRERFTMGNREDGENGQMQRAVTAFFNALHELKGPDDTPLLYKDKRLVNWDPKLQTAISDLEVEQKEVKGSYAWARGQVNKEGNPKAFDAVAFGKIIDREPGGHLYYFNYPLEGVDYDVNNPATFITVATTRPETMLGDTAVAVHPENEKLKHLIGRKVILPLDGRIIPIVGDDYADPEKGTGAVKITPAHDFNDFEVGKRHNGVIAVNILDREGKIDLSIESDYNVYFDNVPVAIEPFNGMDRFDVRKLIVEKLQANNFCIKIEPHTQQVPYGDRSGVPIEPWLTDQWYVNVQPLAEQAMEWVRAGKVKILPATREADFFRWMENIQPWCISRQLWWGHQIPAWYGVKIDNGNLSLIKKTLFVAETEKEAKQKAGHYYREHLERFESLDVCADEMVALKWIDQKNRGKGAPTQVAIWRDPDVLDTWFSSALWPFSTLGWPEDTAELKTYYPTSVLVTGVDILFFWVARMMMAAAALTHKDGTKLEPPFHTVYLHALVRDEKGAKMSKSKGNVIDPLNLIDQYGADALRFTLAAMAAQGRDIKLATSRVEGYRNFATKLWNAARFAEMNGCARTAHFAPESLTLPLNKWIVAEAKRAADDVASSIESFRFNDAANAAYRFGWNIFCDWYVELTKPIVQGEDGAMKDETRATTAYVIDILIALLHPFMPFITEELWAIKGQQGPARASLLTLAPWPELPTFDAQAAETDIGWLIEVISEIRSLRSEMNVPTSAQLPLVLVAPSAEVIARSKTWDDMLRRLGRVARIDSASSPPKGSAQFIVRGTLIALPLEGIIDLSAERARLSKEIGKLESDIVKIDAKLNNADFMARAPEEIVEENRERRADCEARIAKMKTALQHLG
jgi:valyl-tRNA synthetase